MDKLLQHIPNDPEGQEFIRAFKKYMKGSKYKMRVIGRGKKGPKLWKNQQIAERFCIYITPKKVIEDDPYMVFIHTQ